MRKLAVALVTIATLGMYTPTALLEVHADEAEGQLSKSDVNQEPSVKQEVLEHTDLILDKKDNEEESYYQEMNEHIKMLSMEKFGPRISNQVEDEFTTTILPAMEYVIRTTIEKNGNEVENYGITESPTSGYGERIFHVYDYQNERDLARFHVRRDNRPMEGYYFNFHYHLSEDGFKDHHEIGEIYWDKNTPPKWMA
ncbi:YpjP family protein [Oceanobacillus senegalensis]|uniref:YpjP family protein n=1 Tax=Oceanobacillus senegalensis TaxID=1936063 RepID=UPI001FEAD71E|nr:YpjP family protein [Oceanobacillus senegalensis]